MKQLLFIIAVVVVCYTLGYYTLNTIQKYCNTRMEYAYFEGQKDALAGDMRIKKVKYGYMWIKSPWDNSTPSTSIVDNPRYILVYGLHDSKQKERE